MHDSVSAGFVVFSAGYDPVGRIRSFGTTGDTASYGYDANGNRESSTRVLELADDKPKLPARSVQQQADGLQSDPGGGYDAGGLSVQRQRRSDGRWAAKLQL